LVVVVPSVAACDEDDMDALLLSSLLCYSTRESAEMVADDNIDATSTERKKIDDDDEGLM
jgi:hypothetical protein